MIRNNQLPRITLTKAVSITSPQQKVLLQISALKKKQAPINRVKKD
jgi:hypothetical protein